MIPLLWMIGLGVWALVLGLDGLVWALAAFAVLAWVGTWCEQRDGATTCAVCGRAPVAEGFTWCEGCLR